MQASKAVRFFKDITLNDGRVVNATLVGDENIHFYRATDGEIILYNLDGDYYYSASEEEIDSLKNISNNLEHQNMNKFKTMISSITSSTSFTPAIKASIRSLLLRSSGDASIAV